MGSNVASSNSNNAVIEKLTKLAMTSVASTTGNSRSGRGGRMQKNMTCVTDKNSPTNGSELIVAQATTNSNNAASSFTSRKVMSKQDVATGNISDVTRGRMFGEL